MNRLLIVILILLLFPLACLAAEPPSTGNFMLRSSQQPGPLVGFGGNIIDKNQTFVILFADDYIGIDEHYIDFAPFITYGINDLTSITIVLPYAVSYKSEQQKSNGFEDAYAQLEYAFYVRSTSRFTEQATILGNITVPTGSIQKNPATGAGSPSFFLGGTYNRTYADWFVFGATGALLTTTNRGTKYANNYLYQMGFGRNIMNINRWILAWITEVNGTYTEHNRIHGVVDPDSGGNVIYVTPSFWASTNEFIFQLGAGVAAAQHWNGNQNRNTYLLVANIGISF